MKQIIEIRHNGYYIQDESIEPFGLYPMLEIVIIHTDGKGYEINEGKITNTTIKTDETRFMLSASSLDSLNNSLALIKVNMDMMVSNANQMNEIIKLTQQTNK